MRTMVKFHACTRRMNPLLRLRGWHCWRCRRAFFPEGAPMGKRWAGLRTRLRHPSYVDTLYRARCECGWTGPVREWEMDAQGDRSAHWAHLSQPEGAPRAR